MSWVNDIAEAFFPPSYDSIRAEQERRASNERLQALLDQMNNSKNQPLTRNDVP